MLANNRVSFLRRIGNTLAGFVATIAFLCLLVGIGYLVAQVIAAFEAVRDLDYEILSDETLVVVFRNLLWGVSAAAGAAVALLGVGLAAWRTLTQHRQSQIEQRRVETETFSKAMELLGNKEFAIRLGGILQLETLAQQSRRLHWPIMEAFCADLRQSRPAERRAPSSDTGMPPLNASGGQSDGSDGVEAFPADLQAIVTAIGRRNYRHDPAGTRLPLERVNLSGANLQRANLKRADLAQANLDRADLQEAHLEGSQLGEAHLTGAKLGRAHLPRAYLRRVHLEDADLSRAYLQRADLRRAHLEGADFTRTHLEGADFHGSDVTQAQISKARCNAETRLPDGLKYSSGLMGDGKPNKGEPQE